MPQSATPKIKQFLYFRRPPQPNTSKRCKNTAKSLQNAATNDAFPMELYHFLTISDFPVISAGCSMPITSISVGTMSARTPPSLSVTSSW